MFSSARSRHTRRHYSAKISLTLLLGAVLLAGLLPGDAAAVTNAAKSTQMPWSVRLLISRIDSDEGMRCTGVALTQHWILTSAHCLEGRAKSTDEVQVDLGEGTTPLYPSGTGSYYNHPDYDTILGYHGDWGDDIGLVRLYGEGIFPELRAKIYHGREVEDPSRWKEAGKIFFVARSPVKPKTTSASDGATLPPPALPSGAITRRLPPSSRRGRRTRGASPTAPGWRSRPRRAS